MFEPHKYRGRFAPSPTGPLHLGSLLAALGSYLQAKKNKGSWLVRIDDLDPPRELKGATSSILYTLESYGLYWDEEIIYQSQRHDLYEQALAYLDSRSLIYNCTCSRKMIKEKAVSGPVGYIYPGTCRDKNILSNTTETGKGTTTRLKTQDLKIEFYDLLQGAVSQQISSEIGDVALKRADGLFAYHLAVVVDDFEQNITEIVRGIDLMACTPIQIYLQNLFNYPTPDYLHLPILVNRQNEKLSKQTKAKAVTSSEVGSTLIRLLTLLNQEPPKALEFENKEQIILWAIENWDINKIGNNNRLLA